MGQSKEEVVPDKVTFYKDNKGEWRWRRTDGNNSQIIGAATEGYKDKFDCEANFRRQLLQNFTIDTVL